MISIDVVLDAFIILFAISICFLFGKSLYDDETKSKIWKLFSNLQSQITKHEKDISDIKEDVKELKKKK